MTYTYTHKENTMHDIAHMSDTHSIDNVKPTQNNAQTQRSSDSSSP